MRPASTSLCRTAVLLAALLCLAPTGPAGEAAVSADTAPATGRALWIWSTPAPDAVATALAHDIDRLFVHVPPGGTASPDLQALLRHARRAGLQAWAMAGAPDWAQRPRRMVRWVAEVGRMEGIRGAVLDVEPYVLPEWDSTRSRKRVLRRYLRGLERAAARSPQPLVAAVPFWWDHADQRLGGVDVVERVLDAVDGIVVMAYRDRPLGRDGIVDHAAGEIAAAGRRGKTALIGVQTAPDELDKLTFHEEGLGAMQAALEQVQAVVGRERGFGGFAIHHLDALLQLH